MAKIRVLMIDDSPLIRRGLSAVLEDRADIEIVGEAGRADQGLVAVEQHQPDVVLLDLNLPDKPGFFVCRELVKRQPKTRILILTSAADEQAMRNALAAGAHGYLLKDNDGTTLANAILQVAAGHSVLDPSLTHHVLNMVKRGPESRPEQRVDSLSHQERRVLALLAEGLTNKEIGDRLTLTEKTVKNYLSTVFDKLQVSRRAQAAALYTKSNEVGPR